MVVRTGWLDHPDSWQGTWNSSNLQAESFDITLNSGIPIYNIFTHKWFCPNTEWGQNTNSLVRGLPSDDGIIWQGRSIIRKYAIMVVYLDVVPVVICKVIEPISWTLSPAKPTKGKDTGLNLSWSNFICSNEGQYKISVELPLSRRIWWMDSL
jgi:hypothetical protein